MLSTENMTGPPTVTHQRHNFLPFLKEIQIEPSITINLITIFPSHFTLNDIIVEADVKSTKIHQRKMRVIRFACLN